MLSRSLEAWQRGAFAVSLLAQRATAQTKIQNRKVHE